MMTFDFVHSQRHSLHPTQRYSYRETLEKLHFDNKEKSDDRSHSNLHQYECQNIALLKELQEAEAV